jgi:hypothetical protein
VPWDGLYRGQNVDEASPVPRYEPTGKVKLGERQRDKSSGDLRFVLNNGGVQVVMPNAVNVSTVLGLLKQLLEEHLVASAGSQGQRRFLG